MNTMRDNLQSQIFDHFGIPEWHRGCLSRAVDGDVSNKLYERVLHEELHGVQGANYTGCYDALVALRQLRRAAA